MLFLPKKSRLFPEHQVFRTLSGCMKELSFSDGSVAKGECMSERQRQESACESVAHVWTDLSIFLEEKPEI